MSPARDVGRVRHDEIERTLQRRCRSRSRRNSRASPQGRAASALRRATVERAAVDVGADATRVRQLATAVRAGSRPSRCRGRRCAARGCACRCRSISASASSTTVSVSGRGTSTAGVTMKRQPPEFASRRRCARPVRRRAGAPRSSAIAAAALAPSGCAACRHQRGVIEPERVADQDARVELGRVESGAAELRQRARGRATAPLRASRHASSAASNSA